MNYYYYIQKHGWIFQISCPIKEALNNNGANVGDELSTYADGINNIANIKSKEPYILNEAILGLDENSTSQQILDAFGGESKYLEFIENVKTR